MFYRKRYFGALGQVSFGIGVGMALTFLLSARAIVLVSAGVLIACGTSHLLCAR